MRKFYIHFCVHLAHDIKNVTDRIYIVENINLNTELLPRKFSTVRTLLFIKLIIKVEFI